MTTKWLKIRRQIFFTAWRIFSIWFPYRWGENDISLLTACNGLLVCIGLYLLLFWLTVGYYVYSDSEKREFSNPQLRGVVLGILGLLVNLYIVQRQDWVLSSRLSDSMKCAIYLNYSNPIWFWCGGCGNAHQACLSIFGVHRQYTGSNTRFFSSVASRGTRSTQSAFFAKVAAFRMKTSSAK